MKKSFLINNKLSLLFAEDYIPLRNEMTEILVNYFGKVIVASNGKEALSLYKKEYRDTGRYIDIVLSDIEMPILNGMELTKQIFDINSKQKIVILSAHTDTDYLISFINLGISQFITKPIDYEDFIDKFNLIIKELDLEKKSIKNIIEDKNIIDLGDSFIWDKKRSILLKDGIEVTLTRHEILLLELMSINVDCISTNGDIMNYFYDEYIDIEEKNIRNMLFKLRRKLPNDAIDTVYGMGYKLISKKS